MYAKLSLNGAPKQGVYLIRYSCKAPHTVQMQRVNISRLIDVLHVLKDDCMHVVQSIFKTSCKT